MDEQAVTHLSEADRLKAMAKANRRKRHDKVADELTEQGWYYNELTWYTSEQERAVARGDGLEVLALKKGVRIGKGPKGVGAHGRQQGRPRKYADDPLRGEQQNDVAQLDLLNDDEYVDQMDEDISPVKKRGRPAKTATRRKQMTNEGPGLTKEPVTVDSIRPYAGRITKPPGSQGKPTTPRKLGSPFNEGPRSLPRKQRYNKSTSTGPAMSENLQYPSVTSMDLRGPAPGYAASRQQSTGSMAPPSLPKPKLGQYDYNRNTYMPVAGSYSQMQPPSAHMQAYEALQNQMAAPYQVSQQMQANMTQSQLGQMTQPAPYATAPYQTYSQMPQPAYAPQGGYAALAYGLNQTDMLTGQGSYGSQDGLPAPTHWGELPGPPNYDEPPSDTMRQAVQGTYNGGVRRDSKFPDGGSNIYSTDKTKVNLLTQPTQLTTWVPSSHHQGAQQLHQQTQAIANSFDQQHGLPSQPSTMQTSQYFDPAATGPGSWHIGQGPAFHEPPPFDDPVARADSRYNPLNMFRDEVAHGLPSNSRHNIIAPAATMLPTSTQNYQDNSMMQEAENEGMVDPRLTMDGLFDGMDIGMEGGDAGAPDWDALMADGGFEVGS
ncbi:hypothetical protein LTR95_002987 [Oleoguttula sp. CCFEE 5521]